MRVLFQMSESIFWTIIPLLGKRATPPATERSLFLSKRIWWKPLLAFTLITSTSLSYWTETSYAAIPTLDKIRVALFIETDKYSNTTPYVTISAASGLSTGNRRPASTTSWFSGVKSFRASPDRFGVQVLETPDYTLAAGLRAKLAETGVDAVIWKRTKLGQPLYQVSAGPYPTREAAAAALDLLSQKSSLAPLLKSPMLTGPLHLSSGTFATEEEAATRQQALAQAGLIADLIYAEDASGKITFGLFIGSEADTLSLTAIRTKAIQSVPGLQLQEIPAGTVYAMKREDVTGGAGDNARTPHLILSSSAKLWITPLVETDKLTIKEKSGAGYRGAVELSTYGNQLAVVNELPFEQYVASVVASEMGKGWPLEALKAQAVSARTYALAGGMKYKIAHISDTTVDQAFVGKESDDSMQAANATKGEVLTDGKGLIEPVYSANSGGMTADPSEIWGGTSAYLKPVSSPDEGPAQGKAMWKRVMLQNGSYGYVHSSYVKDTGLRNAAGLPIFASTENDLNVRSAPMQDNTRSPSLGKLKMGERVTVVGEELESNDYSWFRGPFSGADIAGMVRTGVAGITTVSKLEVSKKGPSGRVMELKANGQPVKVQYPYLYRTILSSLPSSKFEIEETGRYTIQGAGGSVRTEPEVPGALYVLGGGQSAKAVTAKPQTAVMNGAGQIRIVSMDPAYVIRGNGNGHGMGLSQWGARSLAEQGYDYQQILKRYYTGVSIVRTD